MPSSATLTSTVSPRRRAATRDGPAVGRELDGVVDEVGEHLAQLLPVGRREPAARPEMEHEAAVPFTRPLAHRHHLPQRPGRRPSARASTSSVAGVEPGDVEQVVDDASEPLGLGRDVARGSRAAPSSGEVHVLAQQRLGEAVDRGQRRAQLVRDGRDEVGAASARRRAPRETSRKAKIRPATAPAGRA